MSSRAVLDPKHKDKFVWKPGDLKPVSDGKAQKYSEDQLRDDHGRFATGGGVATEVESGFGMQRGTQWDYDPRDTAREREALRENPAAQENRAEFPRGTRVVSVGSRSNPEEVRRGTVTKTHPDGSADGGSVGVDWDGYGTFVGQVNPNAIVREDEWEQYRAVTGKRFEFIETPDGLFFFEKYSDDQPRDDHGRWTDGGGDAAEADLTATRAALYGDHAGTPADPVPCGSDIERAAKIIADGGNVTLSQPQEIATLLDKMQELVQEAEARGEKAPTFDLCDVSVPGTNLFCQDHVVDDQGNPLDRIQMPQLATTDPVPGSLADQQPRNQFGEVDLSGQFAEFLAETGRPPVEETVDAATLRASQDQLNGAKVAGIVDAIEAGTYDVTTGRIWITSDNYVIDGHHRWAAAVAEGYSSGEPVMLPVRRLDMDIGTALTTANYWTEENGIQGRSLTAKSVLEEALLKIQVLECGIDLSIPEARKRLDLPPLPVPESLSINLAEIGIKFSPDQERDDHGRWTSGGGGGSATAPDNYREAWKPAMTPEQGHAWAEAAGTKYPNTVVHITTNSSEQGIVGTGFHTDGFGTLHESGAYFATDPDTAEFYDYKGRDAISAVVVLQNPVNVDLTPVIASHNEDASYASPEEFRQATLAAAGVPPAELNDAGSTPQSATEALKALGYDGVIIHGLQNGSMFGENESAVGGNQLVVFDKEQAVVIGTEQLPDEPFSTEPAFPTNAERSSAQTFEEDMQSAIDRAFAKTLELFFLNQRIDGMKFDPNQERDDHGRWTSGGGGDLGAMTAGRTDEGLRGRDHLTAALEREQTIGGGHGSAMDNAVRLKTENVKEIGDALAERAKSDPALAAQLQGAAEHALLDSQGSGFVPGGGAGFVLGEDGTISGTGTDFQVAHLHLEEGMTAEEVGARQVAAQMQDAWMSSASDSSQLAWGIQTAVGERLGLDPQLAIDGVGYQGVESRADWGVTVGLPPVDQSSLTPAPDPNSRISLDEVGKAQDVAMVQRIADSPAVKAYVDEVYNRTQTYLKDNDVTGDVTMYRGIRTWGWSEGDQEVKLNPTSSFSTDIFVANSFADSGYVVTATFPVERIWSLPTTGPGCLNENEAIVAGGEQNVEVSRSTFQ